ncbi:MAG: sulfur carrier protein ThiS adenylyltransferase ThiF [bacterium]|nr:sulfur carrier protein ThiS adenylyltransferase ThiF [bacterium]
MNTYLTENERRILEGARIGIAGAGGLGSNCAVHLVRAGVRRLVICDFDVVNESNLNRQFYFRDQLGRKKVDALEENLRRIEPDLDLDMRDLRLDSGNISAVFADCDIVVEAFDSADAKIMLLQSLMPMGKRLVTASGLAGWGRSGEIVLRRMGPNVIAIGDGTTSVGNGIAPHSPRVGIAAAMEANTVIAWLLDRPV